MITPLIIGNKIAEARKRMSISQARLAERLFISSQAVGKWERGESMPDIITFNRLAEILGVDLNYFSENFQSTEENATGDSPVDQFAGLSSGERKKVRNWDMSRGNWSGADFSGLKNLHDKFSSSNMQQCLFIGSELSGLVLKNNNVDRCDFSGSDFSRNHIQRSNLSKNLFKNCSLNETEFSGSFVYGCDFTGADLTGVMITSGGFEKNTVTDAIMYRTIFIDTALIDIVFEGRVEDCSFENCAFTRVTFRNATLTNTFFKNKNMKRIRFMNCRADRLTCEFLKNGRADLTGITLIDTKEIKE